MKSERIDSEDPDIKSCSHRGHERETEEEETRIRSDAREGC